MGTPKITDVQQKQPMADHMKSIKELLKKPFQAIFQKNKKEKQKNVDTVAEKKRAQTVPVEEVMESFKKLEIEKPKEESTIDVEDELKNFQIITITDEGRKPHVDSQCSDDSGIADNWEGQQDKSSPKDETEQKKTKKTQTVIVPRGLQKKSVSDYVPRSRPYPTPAHEQINQVNRQTFSGGQVIVNPSAQPPIEEALKGVDQSVNRFKQQTELERIEDWKAAQDFLRGIVERKEYDAEEQPTSSDALPFGMDFSLMNDTNADLLFANDARTDLSFANDTSNASVFLTPPRSENSLSPLSDSHNSYYPTTDFMSSVSTMSPDMYNSDYEKYQEITPLEEYPSCVTENMDEKVLDTTKPERVSMTMKQFKDMQKEIANGFSKMECCQENRKPCKEILKEYFHRLKIDERKDLCLKVAHLGLDDVYGVLQHVLLGLSNSTKDEDLHHALFTLICEKVLALKPTFFVDEFGLNVLKVAVFRCHTRPLLTRYLVECIRVVTRGEGYKSVKGHVFHEVDAVGDTVLSACARAGDAYAPVLAELVRAQPADTPLFDVHHVNADGYTALHVACTEHSAASPRAHTAHVLLQHGHADLWKGDIKGGDTAVHLAVNSVGCSLTLLLLLFRPLPRANWKKLAHAPNRSSVTPLEYARSAIKSASRQNYPTEVLDFLKKCR